MRSAVYDKILRSSKKRHTQFAVLIDPDKSDRLSQVIKESEAAEVDYFFVGGSLLTSNCLDQCILEIKNSSDIPVVLFPGSVLQITPKADAILFLSLISGRNPDLLIGKHVVSAPILKSSHLEILSTGYVLIDGGKPTTASYISNTQPVPFDKEDIAACTAMAGEMLGLKLIYMDTGSGALNPVSDRMIKKVKKNISIPLIVGGGIKTPENAYKVGKAGADIIVVGNAIENNISLIKKISKVIKKLNQ